MSELKFNFGKYASKTMKEVVMEDPNYCKWAMSQPFCPPEAKEFISKNIILEPTMPWGKHKGKLLSSIARIDYNYIKWLLGNEFVKTKCPDLLSELNKIVDQYNQPNIVKDGETKDL